MFKTTVHNQGKCMNLLLKRKKNTYNFFKAFCVVKPLFKTTQMFLLLSIII